MTVGQDTQYDPVATLTKDLYLTNSQLNVAVEGPPGTRVAAHVRLWNQYGFEVWNDSTPSMPAQFGTLEPGDYWILAWPAWYHIPELAVGEVKRTEKALSPYIRNDFRE